MKQVLIITLALVFGLGVAGLAAGTFSGEWITDFMIGPPLPHLPAPEGYVRLDFSMSSVLTVNYTIAGWAFRSVSTVTEDSWTKQDLRTDGALGAFTLTSHLRFVPITPAFTFLRSTAATTLAGIDFETRFLVVPDGSGLRLRTGGPVDGMTFMATVYFGSLVFDPKYPLEPWAVIDPTHDLTFRGLDIDIEMRFYSFMLTIDADFTTAGFQDITFSVPAFPLGIPGFTATLEVKYELDKKTVTVEPAFAIGEWVHFQPFISVVGEDGSIDGLRLDGLRMTWVVDPRVTFIYEWDRAVGEPWIAGRRPVGITPRLDYQQRIMIGAEIGLIGFDAAFAWLHGIEPMPMFPQDIDLDLSVAIMPQLDLRAGVGFVDRTFSTLTFGFTVDW